MRFQFVIAFVLSSVVLSALSGEAVTIYKDKHHSGTSSKINFLFSKCVDFESNMRDQVSSINTQGECVILWFRSDCRGYYARIAPGTKNHHDLSQVFFNNNSERKVEDDALSISTCDIVMLYQEPNHGGTEERIQFGRPFFLLPFLPFAGSNCVNFTTEMKNKVSSINTFGQCVKLWYLSGCTGSYARIAPGTKDQQDFTNLKFDDNTDRNLNNNVESISLDSCTTQGNSLIGNFSIYFYELFIVSSSWFHNFAESLIGRCERISDD